MTEHGDAVDILTRDHRRVEALFGQYEGTTDQAEQTRIAHEVVHELAVHGEIEELLFYPTVRDRLERGDALADEAVHEHVEIKETLNAIDSMEAGEEGFDARMRELMAEVRHHVEEEEAQLFPRIREALSAEELTDLGQSLEGARAVVPTRPHPSAPTGPIGKMVASPPVALIDRVRDAVRGFVDDRRE
jgi:hemerythrin superfamily protein